MKIRLISLALSLSILFLMVYFSSPAEVFSILSNANIYYILLGILVSFFLMAFRTFRWKILLGRLGINMNLGKLFPIFMSAAFLSNITPAKSGDPGRSYFLKRRTGLSFSTTLPSVVVERIMDIIIMIAISILGLTLVPLGEGVGIILAAVVVIYASLISIIVWISSKKERLRRFLWIVQKFFWWFPKIRELKKKTGYMTSNFRDSFLKYKNTRTLAGNTILSVVVWILEGLIVYLSFLSVGLHASIFLCIFFLSISTLVGILSSLPGGIGSSEVVMALLFTSVLVTPLPQIVSAILLARFISFWLGTAVGAMFFKI